MPIVTLSQTFLFHWNDAAVSTQIQNVGNCTLLIENYNTYEYNCNPYWETNKAP